MRVLVTGATGFVGRAIVAGLAGQGHEARCLVRRPGSAAAIRLGRQAGVELVAGDLLGDRNLSAIARGCDAVIHLVGIIAEVGRNTFERAHVEATRSMVDWAVAGGANRFIHMSALGTRPNAVSRYHITKWAAEEAVRASPLEWTIFRPSLIHGPEDDFVNRFARLSAVAPLMPIIGPGTHRLQPVHVNAVAGCFVRALDTPCSVRQTYDLCGDDRLTFDELLDGILAALGRRRLKLHLPVGLAMMMAAVMESLWPRLLNRPPPLNRDQVVMLQEDNIGNPRPAREAFSFGPDSFAESLRTYLGGKEPLRG